MWQYVFNAIKDNPGSDQEVVIVTDGIDNDSDFDFRGTNGYNHMMEPCCRHSRPRGKILTQPTASMKPLRKTFQLELKR